MRCLVVRALTQTGRWRFKSSSSHLCILCKAPTQRLFIGHIFRLSPKSSHLGGLGEIHSWDSCEDFKVCCVQSTVSDNSYQTEHSNAVIKIITKHDHLHLKYDANRKLQIRVISCHHFMLEILNKVNGNFNVMRSSFTGCTLHTG